MVTRGGRKKRTGGGAGHKGHTFNIITLPILKTTDNKNKKRTPEAFHSLLLLLACVIVLSILYHEKAVIQ